MSNQKVKGSTKSKDIKTYCSTLKEAYPNQVGVCVVWEEAQDNQSHVLPVEDDERCHLNPIHY